MEKNIYRFINVCGLIITLFASLTLFYVSTNTIAYKYYFILRVTTALAMFLAAIFVYLRNKSNTKNIFSIILIILYVCFAIVFLLYKTNRSEWINIDQIGGCILLIPSVIVVYEVLIKNKENINFDIIKNKLIYGLSNLITFFIIASIAYWMYEYYSKKGDYINFKDLTEVKQLVELSPWADYSGRYFLFISANGNFTIEDEYFDEKKINVIYTGKWEYEQTTKHLTLIYPSKKEHYQYNLQYDNAYLGTEPIEKSILGETWSSFIPTLVKKNN